MVSAINAAVSGLHAASRRLQISAENVANQHSTSTIVDGQVIDKPYTPKQVASLSHALGGVTTEVRDIYQPTIKIFNPAAPNADANGFSEVPNVNIEEEIVNQLIASYDYRANLKSIKTANELQKNLLDIIS